MAKTQAGKVFEALREIRPRRESNPSIAKNWFVFKLPKEVDRILFVLWAHKFTTGRFYFNHTHCVAFENETDALIFRLGFKYEYN